MVLENYRQWERLLGLEKQIEKKQNFKKRVNI